MVKTQFVGLGKYVIAVLRINPTPSVTVPQGGCFAFPLASGTPDAVHCPHEQAHPQEATPRTRRTGHRHRRTSDRGNSGRAAEGKGESGKQAEATKVVRINGFRDGLVTL